MPIYKHIYKTENENGKWEINEYLCDICRKESNEYNRSYPGFVIGAEYVVYKTRVVKDKLHIYLIKQTDERTKEIKQILCEHLYKDGSVKLKWNCVQKYKYDKKCTFGSNNWFVFGKKIKIGTFYESMKDEEHIRIYHGKLPTCMI